MTAEPLSFKVMRLPALLVIGKQLRVHMEEGMGNPIPAFWQRCFQDGTVARLQALPDRRFPETIVGWMGCWNPDDRTFLYLVGVLRDPGAEVPEGLAAVELPETVYAVCTIRGPEPDIYQAAERYMAQERDARQLVFDDSLGYSLEWYDRRFDGAGAIHVIDYLAPIKGQPQE